MSSDLSVYPLKFIQKKPCHDDSAHLFTLIYTFKSHVTCLKYVLLAEFHRENVFAIKFYAKRHRKSDLKYSKLINRGDVNRILTTVASLVPLLLNQYPDASFGFIGSRAIDFTSKTVEPYSQNQRYRIYRVYANRLFGSVTFRHFRYDEISAYLLIKNNSKNIIQHKNRIESMFIETYSDIHDLSLLRNR